MSKHEPKKSLIRLFVPRVVTPEVMTRGGRGWVQTLRAEAGWEAAGGHAAVNSSKYPQCPRSARTH
jgi:hypothetical protein